MEPVSHREFLELVAQGCAIGTFRDWVQLRAACKWAIAQVDELERCKEIIGPCSWINTTDFGDY